MPVLTPELKMQPAGIGIFGAIARYLALALGPVGGQAGADAGASGSPGIGELRLNGTFAGFTVNVESSGKVVAAGRLLPLRRDIPSTVRPDRDGPTAPIHWRLRKQLSLLRGTYEGAGSSCVRFGDAWGNGPTGSSLRVDQVLAGSLLRPWFRILLT